ncbi:Svx/AvrXca family virulence/avirulence protein [Pectobacterium parvum]|uniref:Svx/AvrXca family virulence/avirulence protein n=1 Tax=Pectobacterium parvum TaxID=2778550 RepID=UPI001E2AC04C|nr:Svx/AvrXca family virulence/avirulence protein [Pectobacterium parvum]UFK40321.1 Svx/AvrXca family virulence/avirulence protein [Pectobacterium parvum]
MPTIKTLLTPLNCLLVLSGALMVNTANAAEACVAGNWQVDNSITDMPSVKYQTEHFAFRWNNNDVNRNDAVAAGQKLEQIWDKFIKQIQFPEPYCKQTVKYKANIHIDPTFGLSGGIAGGGSMGMWIGPASLKDNWGLAHEFTHALQGQTGGFQSSGDNYVGWIWESHANWMTHQMDEFRGTSAHCSEMQVNYSHIYLGSTRNRYCNWQFMEYLKNRFGYGAINDMWAKAPKWGESGQSTADPLSILRTNMGWSQSEFNDVFGDWAMHNVNWDYVDPDGFDRGRFYRSTYGSYGAVQPNQNNADRLLRTTALEPVVGASASLRRFSVPFDQAPQQLGYNIVKLIPESGATKITVKFRGMVQSKSAITRLPGLKNDPATMPQPNSDWRWGIVAVGADGVSRYSELQRGASATVKNFTIRQDDRGIYMVVMGTPSQMQKIKWDQAYYSLYRYPWMADFTGVWPEGSQPGAPNPTANGSRHANGGGWVSNSANVAPTAYVGPYARVIGGTVRDNARIEDRATILSGTVEGRAVVGGLTVLQGNTVVRDNARLHTVFMGPGAFERGIVLSGNAQMRGDAEIRGASASQGVFYGFIDENEVRSSEAGAYLTDAVPEVTAVPVYSTK